MVPELIPVLCSQPAGDVSHKPGGRLPLLSARPAVTPATLKRAATNFAAWWTGARWMWTVCLKLLPDSGCDLNPGPSALESSTLTARVPSYLNTWITSGQSNFTKGRIDAANGSFNHIRHVASHLIHGSRFPRLAWFCPTLLPQNSVSIGSSVWTVHPCAQHIDRHRDL